MAATLQQAIALHRGGDLARAEALYREILARAPQDTDAMHFLGVLRTQQRRYDDAIALIGGAAKLAAGHPGIQSNLGLALKGAGRLEEALASFDRAIRLAPALPEAHNNRGNVALALGRSAEALASFDRAIALRPEYAEAWNNRGYALVALGRLDAAVDSYGRAIALAPGYGDARHNRGLALRQLGRAREALADAEGALALAPARIDSLDARGIALADLGRHADALASFERALAAEPERAASHVNASRCRLALGDYARGWPEHEWRWRDDQMRRGWRDFAVPRWTGEQDLAGRRLLLHAEQGYGDAIQFSRYAPLAAARGAEVVLEVEPALATLLATLAGVHRIVVAGDPLPPVDLHCPLMSLPLAFGTTLDDVPADVPYLAADPARVARWRERLPRRGRPRIGLAWSGNAAQRDDAYRSIPLARLAPLLEFDAEFVVLQKGVRESDRAALASTPRLHDVGGGIEDFADVAALIDGVDLVISVCTSVAHLAGALGKPLWVLLSTAADWRWLRDRDDSPWYPTARLFRQSAPGDWSGPVRQVATALEARLGEIDPRAGVRES
ncbi:MAG: tetratricopeptide repeat protein [Burkholderiales bacterium]|nr:tetratricopeptide repeat protein [Burkholderiales bacterium]